MEGIYITSFSGTQKNYPIEIIKEKDFSSQKKQGVFNGTTVSKTNREKWFTGSFQPLYSGEQFLHSTIASLFKRVVAGVMNAVAAKPSSSELTHADENINKAEYIEIIEAFKEYQKNEFTSLENFMLSKALDAASTNPEFVIQQAETAKVFIESTKGKDGIIIADLIEYEKACNEFDNSEDPAEKQQLKDIKEEQFKILVTEDVDKFILSTAICFKSGYKFFKNPFNDIVCEEEKFISEDLKLRFKLRSILNMYYYDSNINDRKLNEGEKKVERLTNFMISLFDGYKKFLVDTSPEQQKKNSDFFKAAIFSFCFDLSNTHTNTGNNNSKIKHSIYTSVIDKLRKKYQTSPAIIGVIKQIDEFVYQKNLFSRTHNDISEFELYNGAKELVIVDQTSNSRAENYNGVGLNLEDN